MELYDHHASAFDMYAPGIPLDPETKFSYPHPTLPISIYLDNGKSGCGIVYDVFKINELISGESGVRLGNLVNAVEDRDLWQFKLPDTEPYCLMLDSLGMSYKRWDNLIFRMSDGGGWHYHAAGFKLPLSKLKDLLEGKL